MVCELLDKLRPGVGGGLVLFDRVLAVPLIVQNVQVVCRGQVVEVLDCSGDVRLGLRAGA